ncbi:MAG: lytic transglycosylase F [Pseudomonadota bacterium]
MTFLNTATSGMKKTSIILISFFLLISINITLAADGTAKDDSIIGFMNKPNLSNFKQMLKRRYIRALVVYSKTDFFFDKARAKGIQVAFLQQYEKFLNKNVKKEAEKMHIVYIPTPFSELIPALVAGKGDIAASFLTITPERKAKVSFATGGAMKVNELLVSHKDAKVITELADLSGKTLYVLKNSSYVEHLKQLNEDFKVKKIAPVNIEQADENLLSEDIMELVNSGVKKYTIIDDYKAILWAKVLPDIRVHKDIAISKNNTLGWAVRKANKGLQESLNQFAQKVKKGTMLGNMFFKQYFKNTQWIKNPNSKKDQEKLKQFIVLFKKYGDMYQFDYLALLAQAYQESGLDNSKKSHRGAVGIMQLLPSTAAGKNVGIKDISSVEANIHAGAKYLAFVRNRYYSDPKISVPSQFAFSWAAYNAGPARVRKMRALAKKMGLDENKWFNNVEIAAGKIIGRETVQYVAHIYKYYIAYKLSPMIHP